jgi:kynurenine formamidase
VALSDVRGSLAACGLEIETGDTVILATGWGRQCRSAEYLEEGPFFAQDLVDWLSSLQLHLLGVDVPAIDDIRAPYGAVRRLFEATPDMLLLAPLVIDPNLVRTGRYLLSAGPLRIDGVSASLCRVFLIADAA